MKRSADAILIDAEFSALLPTLSDGELAELHESLLTDGCLSPVITWRGHGILLDGHNRYRFCKERDIPFKIDTVELPDRKAALDWIMRNQLGRRNLDPERWSFFVGCLYEGTKRDRADNLSEGKIDEKPNDSTKDQNDQSGDSTTAERIAQQHGTSPATVKRSGKFARAVQRLTEQARAMVLAGQSGSTQAEVAALADADDERIASASVSLASGNGVPRPAAKLATDKAGNEITDPAVADAFADTFSRELLRHLEAARACLREERDDRGSHPSAAMWGERAQELYDLITEKLIYVVEQSLPYAVMPDGVKSRGRATEQARQRGWLTKAQWDAIQKG